MQRFYRGLYRDGLTPARALQRAQVSMWRDEPWRPPYYWAGFVLLGDWSRRPVPPGSSLSTP